MMRREDLSGATARILELQRHDGSIPWVDAGVFDAWNHTESAMALAVMGEIEAARTAFAHLAEAQNKDGSWWCDYGNAAPIEDGQKMADADKPRVRDTNYAAYVASGVLHHYLVTNDAAFLRDFWPTARAAIRFVLAQQQAEGDIRWAARDAHAEADDALLAGNSSIYKSLEAGIRLADLIGDPQPEWRAARARLGETLREKPHRFDRQWESKAHFSMDWYYPALCGALPGNQARARLDAQWTDYVEPGVGVRCTSREPWATVAEACELAMALAKHGERARAETLFGWQARCRDEDGAYWMGWQFREAAFWPADKPSWTQAAVILAADALYGLSPARTFFTAPALPE